MGIIQGNNRRGKKHHVAISYDKSLTGLTAAYVKIDRGIKLNKIRS